MEAVKQYMQLGFMLKSCLTIKYARVYIHNNKSVESVDLCGADLRGATSKIFGLLALTAMLVTMPVMFIVMHPLPSRLTYECLQLSHDKSSSTTTTTSW